MTTAHWAQALRDHWGISAELERLDGEYDLNFRAVAEDGSGYILKVMRPGCDSGFVEMQALALDHLTQALPGGVTPKVWPAKSGEICVLLADENGKGRLVWVQSRLPGRHYAKAAPKSEALIHEFGERLAEIAQALKSFDHPSLDRDLKWNLMDAGWIAAELSVVSDIKRNEVVSEIIRDFSLLQADLKEMQSQAIYNDANDYNVLVDGGLHKDQHISAMIDMGDMCRAPRICDLAVAAAYIVLDHPHPERALVALVKGYHAVSPLSADEVDMIVPLLRMRLAVSVVNSTLMAQENPDDPYVTISQAPAWRYLERDGTAPSLLTAWLRASCGFEAVRGGAKVLNWLDENRGEFAPMFTRDLSNVPLGSLSVENSASPRNPFDMPLKEAAVLGDEFADADGYWLGYYAEPRLVYADPAFRKGPWKASDRRTVHLAIDVFAPEKTPLHAPCDGEVFVVENRANPLDYGGVIILRHAIPTGEEFFTLHGHLDPECCDRLSPGDKIVKGEAFCQLGDPSENGGWSPHVHFQLALTTEGMEADWPGVADPDELDLWLSVCPNPAALLNLDDDELRYQPVEKSDVLEKRKTHFAPNLSLTYRDPVMLMRGWKHHLFDEWGRPYLDAYNNVPHVGHAHPRIQAVAADQLLRMNSNTRYLHPAQTAFADKILSKLPKKFEVCYFVNSGTEANELALRLARAHTGAKGMVTPDHGYHGNTTGVIDISAYKFNAPGGVGQVDWVELVEVADDYRGSFGREDVDRASKFAAQVDPAIARLRDKGHGLAGFIGETYPSVGGQILPPPGYLAEVYRRVRAAGGVCIADEVQTGLGRLGSHYFAFEEQGAEPDIVVLGKPIGNGHPIGVLVTTREIAESFGKGPEYFSTFGGSNLSCRIGKEVLDIVDDERLQENAAAMGNRLLAGLNSLMSKHPAIGDVRGRGLFVGVELINADGSEGTAICSFVKNRMRDFRILIGSEGPKDNVLKIRPPLTVDDEGIDMILWALDEILSEVAWLI